MRLAETKNEFGNGILSSFDRVKRNVATPLSLHRFAVVECCFFLVISTLLPRLILFWLPMDCTLHKR